MSESNLVATVKKSMSLLTVASISSLLFLGAGCASQDSMDKSRTANRGQAQRIAELEQSVDSWRARANQSENARTAYATQLSERDATITSLKVNLQRAEADNDNIIEQLNALNPVMLPADVNAELEDLADANSGLMEYDPQRGMLRLASDLTFDLGSDTVRPEATTALKDIAQILNNADVTAFEIRVVGHTDNVRIAKAATKAKHPTNMHLSVHRAISVEQILASAGIDHRRISVAGWGEYRPLVANAAKGGAKANRRVELYLVPSTQDYELMPALADADDANTGKPVGTGDDEPMK